MDYDDNDFQSQNLHLTGEESTKFSPVLRPYALPKFEFDDTLQGHLRFDSLVETEDFLGIESNQDNQWIEDFSRGNSGIEFSSSAAESCTIARRNNVWSEATSSESVEMLLKSVGQEEIIPVPVQASAKESVMCDELGILTKQMEPSLKHDDNISSRTEDATDLHPALLEDEIPENFYKLKGDAVEERHVVEDSSQTYKCDIISSDQDPNAVSENCSLPRTEGSLSTDGKCENVNQSHITTLLDEFQENRMLEHASTMETQVDNVISSTDNIITTCGGSSNQELGHAAKDISDQQGSGLQAINGEVRELPGPDKSEAEIGVSYRDESPFLSSKVELGKEPNSGNSSISDVEKHSSMIVKQGSNLSIVEGYSNAECSEEPMKGDKYENVVLHSGKEGEDQPDMTVQNVSQVTSEGDGIKDEVEVTALETSSVAVKDDVKFEKHVIEFSSSNSAGFARLDPQMDSLAQTHGHNNFAMDKEVSVVRGCEMGSKDIISSSDASLLSMEEDNKFSKGALSSAELHQETCRAETLNCANSASKVCNKLLNTEYHSLSSSIVESSQICEEKIMPVQVDVQNSNLDVCGHGLDKNVFSSHSHVGKEVVSSSSGIFSTDNKVAAMNLHSDTETVNNSEITLEHSNNAVCMKGDSVPSFSENVVTSDGGQDQSERPPPVLGLTHLDKKEDDKEEAVNRRSTETSEMCLDSELVKRQLLSETGDLSNVGRQDEFETAAGNEVRQECSKELETHPVLIESTEKECDATKTALEKSEDITLKENCEKTTLKDSDAKINPREDEMLTLPGPSSLEKTCCDVDQIGSKEKEATIESGEKVSEKTVLPDTEGEGGNRLTDSDKPTCGSPTVIRAVQPSQSEKKEGKDSKGNYSSKSDTSFTFEVSPLASLSKKESGNSQPFSTVSSTNVSMIVEGSPSIAGFSQQKAKVTKDKSRGSPKVSDGETVRGSAKGSTERKPRRATPKGPGKETSKKRNRTKEGTPMQKSENGEKPSVVSLSPSVIGQLVPSKSVPLLTTTASLPDLNSSASPPSVFLQPFTDSQQVQLRTQIFVYGSLIQGVAPDESYMISAFGGPDGGRSIWESAWRTALERSSSLKSPSVNPETPLPPCSGAKASNQAVKQSGTQTKGITTPAGRASSKSTPSNVVNPMIPLSSPLWSISTPGDAPQSIVVPRGSVMDYQPALSPLRPYQTPPVRNFAAHNTWLSQPSFRGPWVASPQPSPVDSSARFPLLPNMEPVQLTPVKEQSGSHSSGIMHVSPGPMVHSGAPTGVFPGNAPQMDLMKVTASPGQHTTDTKPRKRKKVSNSEDPCPNVFPSQSETEPLSAPAVSHLSGSFTITTPTSLVPKPATEKVIMPVSPVSSTDHRERHLEPRAVLSENFAKVKEAKLHAEEAAALSASAVNHCQAIWSQLDKQKNTGLASDVEAKLASAAVAVAAAASVAKAAAAAAKVAHDAALQANLMADEVLSSSSYGNPNQNNVFSVSDSMNISATSTPVSTMRGDDGTNNSTSIIVAAKEAAKKRVEAASAASKRAENLDAIVKAAELAAEAVSQAGKIVCMGDPLPLKELVEHGPGGYWKVPQVSVDLAVKSKNVNVEQLHKEIAGEDHNISSEHSEEPSADKGTLTTNHAKSTTPREVSTESKEDRVILADGIAGSTTASEKKSKVQKGRKVSDMSKAAGVIPESDIRPASTPIHVYSRGEKGAQSSRDGSSIKEGSQVEVFKNDERFKAAWYPANVLSLQDGKAFVGYKELISDEGPVKEWVALEGEGNESPVIRIARPVVQLEGTKKRRRVAMGDYCWSVGDRVDAFIQDSWWEGVITEKDKNDETSFTILFPAQNKTSVVRACHLRRSLIWKDGEWVEWSSTVAKDFTSCEGDTPQEKRLKMTTAEVEIKDKDEISKRNDAEPGKTEEPRLPGLSANDKVFNIGKNTKDENRPGTLRTARTGLQKEGSRVVFGVPKPGKKRKFMEVSKHYVGDQARKANEAKDSAKISKYLMPQGSGSRGWRTNSKTDLKEKRVAESKLKSGISGKSSSVSSRTLRKNDPSAETVAASDSGNVSDNQAQIRDSIDHVENASGKDKTMEFGSLSSNGEGPILYPSVPQQSNALPSKKAGTSDARSERANKGKLAPIVAGGRLPKIDEDKVSSGKATKSVSEIVEPRRSVRRIQPTSRLLEGLQSSLIISKIPSFSHDRSHKNKSASRMNNNG